MCSQFLLSSPTRVVYSEKTYKTMKKNYSLKFSKNKNISRKESPRKKQTNDISIFDWKIKKKNKTLSDTLAKALTFKGQQSWIFSTSITRVKIPMVSITKDLISVGLGIYGRIRNTRSLVETTTRTKKFVKKE